MSIVHRTLRGKDPEPERSPPAAAGGGREHELHKELTRERARAQALAVRLTATEEALEALRREQAERLQRADRREAELRNQLQALTGRLHAAGLMRDAAAQSEGSLLAQAKARKR